MNRRAFFLSLAATSTSSAENDVDRLAFNRLINNFIKKWNRVVEMAIEDRWDYPTAEAFEKAYDELTSHPMWLRKKRR